MKNENPQGDLFRALTLLEMGRWEQARRELEPILVSSPDDPEVLLASAVLAFGSDDTSGAEEQVELVLAQDPGNEHALVLLSEIRIEQERWSEAEELLIDLIRRHPDDAEVLARYAHLMLCTFHTAKAAELAAAARRLDPDEQLAKVVQLLVSMIEGKSDQSQEQLAELVRDDANSQRVVALIFSSLIERGKYREALAIGQELLRSDPDNSELVESLITLRAHTHWLGAVLRPLQRYGWGGSAVVWILAIVGIRMVANYSGPLALGLTALYLFFCIYSWIYPPLMRRWLAKRGI